MTRFDRYAPGQFSWVDLMTPDVDAAARFYGSLLGWTAEATQDDSGGGYTMFRLGDVAVAGMGGMPDELQQAGVPPHWNSYVTVDDADAAAAFYEALFGWKVLPGDAESGYREIVVGARPNGGMLPWRQEMGDMPPSWSTYFAVVADSQGAVFSVMYLKNADD